MDICHPQSNYSGGVGRPRPTPAFTRDGCQASRLTAPNSWFWQLNVPSNHTRYPTQRLCGGWVLLLWIPSAPPQNHHQLTAIRRMGALSGVVSCGSCVFQKRGGEVNLKKLFSAKRTHFHTGHASTSLSMRLGRAKRLRLRYKFMTSRICRCSARWWKKTLPALMPSKPRSESFRMRLPRSLRHECLWSLAMTLAAFYR